MSAISGLDCKHPLIPSKIYLMESPNIKSGSKGSLFFMRFGDWEGDGGIQDVFSKH